MRMLWVLLGTSAVISAGVRENHEHWSDYGGAPDSAQYSALKQIDRTNVAKLKPAWSFPTGDSLRYAFSPLIADGVAFVLARNNSVIALDAQSGREHWSHASPAGTRLITNRGLNYWRSPDGSERRLFYAENNRLHALDARTGGLIRSFGDNGSVDLRQNLGRNPDDVVLVQSSTPGKVFEDLLILGSATNQEYESAPGDIRAYNVITGKLVWSFHTVPHPGEFGYDTWPKDAWKRVGGANAWGELSLDVERGVVFIPTGSPKYNFYGADRKGADLFGDCLLALDARTGKRLWHFQMVHHDIWDYDNCTAPKLLHLVHDGKPVDAVAQVGKQGFVWVFDRLTGKPLWPLEERPVPKSDVPGEETWPTQPFPTAPPPFARQRFTVENLSPYIKDPAERARWRDDLLSARNEGLFTPPSRRNTVQMPGNNGGSNWGSAAVDPSSGMLYVVSKDLPAMLKLEPEVDPQPARDRTPEQAGEAVYRSNCQVCHHADLKGQPPTVPSLLHIEQRLRPEEVSRIAAQGGGLMPANPKLSSLDLHNLNTFLATADSQTLKPDAGATNSAAKVTRYRSGFNFMLTSDGLSPIAPPWTSITAYDLNRGTITWKRPIGEVPQLAAEGHTDTGGHFPKIGPVVTAGGLIFTGTRDKKIRALDSSTGRTLWEFTVPEAVEGIPAVYESEGRQYILYCAAAQAGEHRGAYIAFALPQGE